MSVSNDPVIRVLSQVTNERTDPRVVVLVAHGLIELMINTIINSRCKQGKKKITKDSRGFPHSIKLIILNEMGILHDDFYQALDRFRDLRNDAAHDPFFEVPDERIENIAEPLGRSLPSRPPDSPSFSDSLHTLCGSLVQNLWANFHGILTPAFAPKIHKVLERRLDGSDTS